MSAPDPLRALTFAGELSHLTLTFRSALLDARADGAPVPVVAARIAADPDVVHVWSMVNDFPRRDYMTFCAERAFRVGVDEAMLRACGDNAAVEYAAALVELTAEQVAVAKDPAASVLPANPAAVATGPVGCYAVSVVCDSGEPEQDKILACALLNAAAETLGPWVGGPGG